MNKHNRSGGYHVAKMIPFEVVGFGTVLALAPKIGFIGAIVAAAALTYATYSVFRAVRAVARQVPTALGYGDVAAHATKKAAAKTAAVSQVAKTTSKPKAITA